MKRSIQNAGVAAGILCLVANFRGAESLPLDQMLAMLADPVTVVTSSGREFSGYPVSGGAAGLVLRSTSDGGEIEYTLGEEEIAAIHLPGQRLKVAVFQLFEAGEAAAARAIVDALFAQRAGLLRLLPEAEVGFFAETLAWYREAGEDDAVLERIHSIGPLLRSTPWRETVVAEELLILLRLGRRPEADRAAEAWIAAAGREADSALGWVVRAQLEWLDEERESAFFTLLHPIVFSGGRRIAYLEHAYAGAIIAASELGRRAEAEALAAEAMARGCVLEPGSWAPFPTFSKSSSGPVPQS